MRILTKKYVLDGLSTPAKVCYGLRRLLSSYSGPLIKLRRDSDEAELDFYAPLYTIDLAAIAAWFDGAVGYIVTWYDQSGNGDDVTNATAATQPTFISSKNTRSGLLFEGSDFLQDVGPDHPQPFEVLGVFTTISAGATQIFLDGNSGVARCIVSTTGPNFRMFAGANKTDGAVNDGNNHNFSVQCDEASSIMRVDGSEVLAADPGVNRLAGITIGNAFSLGEFSFDGHIFELIIFDSLLATADRTAIEADQANYYGVS